ncbi:MAG: hypothetical protein J0L97_03905 [Alphaproteobacteria bacterium]|nr:hypothetical protein [Alphaproteobacteria bacterium]
MRAYSSNEELFQHIRDLAAQLQHDGQAAASQSLKEGLSSFNGLTDGWALLTESITHAIQLCGDSLQSELSSQLNDVLAVVKGVVFR